MTLNTLWSRIFFLKLTFHKKIYFRTYRFVNSMLSHSMTKKFSHYAIMQLNSRPVPENNITYIHVSRTGGFLRSQITALHEFSLFSIFYFIQLCLTSQKLMIKTVCQVRTNDILISRLIKHCISCHLL